MQISNKNGKIITSLSTWKDAFIEVDNPKHWKPGRSAHSLALHFTRPSINGSKGIDVLSEYLGYLGFKNVLFDYAEIEHESRFDTFRGNGRIQDLMIWAKSENHPLAICIEAKVDETFDKNVPDAYQLKEKELKERPNSKALQRLINICEHFYEGTQISDLKHIRYQLLYYLAGSITEAQKIDGVAFMPVFVYHTDSYNNQNGYNNKKDYETFIKSLNFSSIRVNDTIQMYKNKIDGVDVYSAYIEIEKNDYLKIY